MFMFTWIVVTVVTDTDTQAQLSRRQHQVCGVNKYVEYGHAASASSGPSLLSSGSR